MHIDTKIKCVKRELKRRKRIYPHLIKSEKLTQEEADREQSEMLAVLETLTQLKGMIGVAS